MDDTAWLFTKRVFQDAIEETGPERKRVLDAACGPDAELRAHVEALLTAHDEAGDFLSETTVARLPEAVDESRRATTLDRLDRLRSAVAGRYTIERELGRGGMGVVYLARDLSLERPVAIKLLAVDVGGGAGTRQRFLREARTAAGLSHPNIVPVHAVEEQGDLILFVMGFVDGETVRERVERDGPMSIEETVRMLREVASALEYAHGRGVVHRDVKPDNVILESSGGRAMLADFGIASTDSPSALTGTGSLVGTPEYVSPEQGLGGAVDGRSDVYSLGVSCFFALTGRLPFEARTVHGMLAKHLEEPPPPIRALRPDVPQALADAVDRCLAKDPADRFASAEELAEAVSDHWIRRDRGPGTFFAAVMFTDVVEAGVALPVGIAAVSDLRTRHRQALERVVPQWGGEVLQLFGDGGLSVFRSSADAVRAASELQRVFSELEVPVRIGIHQGDVELSEFGAVGDAVDVASRIESLAPPGGVLISARVFEDVNKDPRIETASLGPIHFKSVAEPVDVFAVQGDGLAVPEAGKLGGPAGEPIGTRADTLAFLPWLLFGGILVLAIAAVAAALATGERFNVLSYLGTWAAFAGGLWFLFDRAEDAVSTTVRRSASAWLRNVDPTSATARWPGVFSAAFDQLFGEKHWSWKCFRRSALASILSVAVLFGVYWSIYGNVGEAVAWSPRFGQRLIPTSLARRWDVVALFAALNVVPDFLSLLQTRWVLRLLTRYESFGLVALDALLTGAIAVAAYVVFQWGVIEFAETAFKLRYVSLVLAGLWILAGFRKRRRWTRVVSDLVRTSVVAALAYYALLNVFFWTWFLPNPPPRAETLSEIASSLIALDAQTSRLGITMGVFFYSTFLTSVWLWLYLAGGAMVRIAGGFGIGLRWLRAFTDLDEQPFRSVGFAAVLITTLVFLAGIPLILLS